MSQREAFLIDCRRPLTDLGPFWHGLHTRLARLRFGLSFSMRAREGTERAHAD